MPNTTKESNTIIDKVFKLYEIEKGSLIKWFHEENWKEIEIIFDHIDWMYSYCTSSKWVVHLKAYTPLKKIWEKKYKLHTE